MSIETLLCPCGMRLKTPGAKPGRVGKCPRCGAMLRVPEVEFEAEAKIKPLTSTPEPSPIDLNVDRPTFTERRIRKASTKMSARVQLGGLVACPRTAETHWQGSLLYPLRGDGGLAALGFQPLGFWFATVPMFGLIPGFLAGNALSLFAMIFLTPLVLILAVVGGQTLGFFGQILVTSSLGDPGQPRAPGWSLSEISSTLGRWFWALIVGVVVGGAPTLLYWIYCGEVDWLDRIVLIDLILPGLAYAQMALVATLIHESPLAANPFLVLTAIWRVGWSYVPVCIRTGTALAVVGLLFEGVLWIKDPLGQAIGFWMFWVIALYSAMVSLRWLGLFCHQHAAELGWLPKGDG